jgi:hypothetical protein
VKGSGSEIIEDSLPPPGIFLKWLNYTKNKLLGGVGTPMEIRTGLIPKNVRKVANGVISYISEGLNYISCNLYVQN